MAMEDGVVDHGGYIIENDDRSNATQLFHFINVMCNISLDFIRIYNQQAPLVLWLRKLFSSLETFS